MFAAPSFRVVIANLVIVSGGTLLLAVAEPTVTSIAAALYYLVQTSLVTGALFLLADALSRQRGDVADRFSDGPRLQSFTAIGLLYLVIGVAACGAPPLSGFLGKIMVMQAMNGSAHQALVWTALIFSGFAAALVLRGQRACFSGSRVRPVSRIGRTCRSCRRGGFQWRWWSCSPRWWR